MVLCSSSSRLAILPKNVLLDTLWVGDELTNKDVAFVPCISGQPSSRTRGPCFTGRTLQLSSRTFAGLALVVGVLADLEVLGSYY